MHSFSNHFVLETMDNWTVPKYNFMKHTIMSSVAANLHVVFLRPKNQTAFFVFDKFTLQVNLDGDKSGGV